MGSFEALSKLKAKALGSDDEDEDEDDEDDVNDDDNDDEDDEDDEDDDDDEDDEDEEDDEEDDEYEDYQSIIDEQDQHIIDFIQGVDCAVIDSQYTAEEYKIKSGWGHSTYYMGMKMAEKAGIKNLYLTHHDPERKDAELDEIYEHLLAHKKEKNYKTQVQLAMEDVGLNLS